MKCRFSLLLVVLMSACHAGAINSISSAQPKNNNTEITRDIERQLEALISIDTNKTNRASIGAIFNHSLDLELSESGFRSCFYAILKLLDVNYFVSFAEDYVAGEFVVSFRWGDDLPYVSSPEPPRNICISVSNLLRNAGSKGWSYLQVREEYTTRSAYYMSKQPNLHLEPVDSLMLVSSKNSDCLVNLGRSRLSTRLPL